MKFSESKFNYGEDAPIIMDPADVEPKKRLSRSERRNNRNKEQTFHDSKFYDGASWIFIQNV